MDKVAAYKLVLSHSDLWDAESLDKLGAVTAEDLWSAEERADIAATLHGIAHLGPGILTSIPAGYVQRTALERAGIDRREGGPGTFGANHPILSGFVPFAGTVSGLNAAERINAKARKMRDAETPER